MIVYTNKFIQTIFTIINLSILKQTFALQADVVRVADDDVVEDFDAQQFARFHQPLVQTDVNFGGGGVAGGVIMNKDK